MKSYFHEIVKYHPAGYKDRIYTFDDWTSISDIGKIFRTGILSADDYIKVEDSYVNTILTVMSETDCHYLTIEYVEAYDDEIVKRMKEYKQRYNIPVWCTYRDLQWQRIRPYPESKKGEGSFKKRGCRFVQALLKRAMLY